jgi:hypothetical protein
MKTISLMRCAPATIVRSHIETGRMTNNLFILGEGYSIRRGANPALIHHREPHFIYLPIGIIQEETDPWGLNKTGRRW